MNKKGFSLMEVIIAMAIALLMLTALLSLEVKSSVLASRAIRGFDSLPVAIERIEELTQQDFSGASQEYVGDYQVRTTSKQSTGEVSYTRIKVEVLQNGDSLSELSLFKFKIQ